MNYNKLLDGEILAFNKAVDACYPADDAETADVSIDQQRKLYSAMSATLAAELPADISFNDQSIPTTLQQTPLISDDIKDLPPDFSTSEVEIDTRLYTPVSDEVSTTDTVIVYMHGGGFILGNLESHHDVCAEICKQTGRRVLSVDYRLAPEHHHPAAYNDAVAAATYAVNNFSEVLLCGDSAGANLCAAVCSNHVALASRIKAQVLIYPALHGCFNRKSHLEHAEAPHLSRDDLLFYSAIRVSEQYKSQVSRFADSESSKAAGILANLNNEDQAFFRTLNPMFIDDFSRIPVTTCFAAECDPLHDDSTDYCNAINAAGRRAICISEAGLVHGYLRARHRSDRARKSFGSIVEELAQTSKT